MAAARSTIPRVTTPATPAPVTPGHMDQHAENVVTPIPSSCLSRSLSPSHLYAPATRSLSPLHHH